MNDDTINLMEGRILSEVLIAGKVNVFELARRCRIGLDEPTKEDGRVFIETFRQMLTDKKLIMNVDHEVSVHGPQAFG